MTYCSECSDQEQLCEGDTDNLFEDEDDVDADAVLAYLENRWKGVGKIWTELETADLAIFFGNVDNKRKLKNDALHNLSIAAFFSSWKNNAVQSTHLLLAHHPADTYVETSAHLTEIMNRNTEKLLTELYLKWYPGGYFSTSVSRNIWKNYLKEV